MSNSLKFGIAATALILVVIGVTMYVGNQGAGYTPVYQGVNGTMVINTKNTGASVLSSDKSDAALTKDQATLDAQLNSLNTDSASVDKAMNDQPVPQTY